MHYRENPSENSLSRCTSLRAQANLIFNGDPLYMKAVEVVLSNPDFSVWTGCAYRGPGKPQGHHYGTGGLCQHVWEVIRICLTNARFFVDQVGMKIDTKALFLAALYHDIGKIRDYQLDSEGVWRSLAHKWRIHHVSRSGQIWNDASHDFPQEFRDEVLHAVLGHHGQKEWGSPVNPDTPIAWILHLADMMSARLEDTQRLHDKYGLRKED